jgi:hypothetical protein
MVVKTLKRKHAKTQKRKNKTMKGGSFKLGRSGSYNTKPTKQKPIYSKTSVHDEDVKGGIRLGKYRFLGSVATTNYAGRKPFLFRQMQEIQRLTKNNIASPISSNGNKPFTPPSPSSPPPPPSATGYYSQAHYNGV